MVSNGASTRMVRPRARGRRAGAGGPSLTLECIAGPCAGAVFELDAMKEHGVGRTKRGNAVWIRGDDTVSQKHATISWSEERSRWEIRDVGSSNGTEVDGEDAEVDGESVGLRDGSVVKLGTETTLRCRLNGDGDGANEDADAGERVVLSDVVNESDRRASADASSSKRDAYAFDPTSPDVAGSQAAPAARKRARATKPPPPRATTIDNPSSSPAMIPDSSTDVAVDPRVPTTKAYADRRLAELQSLIRADAAAAADALRKDATLLIADLRAGVVV